MLLRRAGHHRVAIAQPSHAWVSGQLAGLWGNQRFARPEPFADFCLAAALHDVGWLDWERAPVRDPETGWPLAFPQVAKRVHVDLWREGVRRTALFGRYPALLVSRHADTIYSRHVDRASLTADDATVVRAFLDEQHDLQRDLAAALRADPVYGEHAGAAAIERNRLLLAAVDELSLHLCWGLREAAEIADVPVGSGGAAVTLRLQPAAGAVVVDPWPFGPDTVTVTAEGRVLERPFADDDGLRAGLAAAPVTAVTATLRRG